MKIDQFESDDMRRKDDRPWRVHAPPINKNPSNPDYPQTPFNSDDWNKQAGQRRKSIDEGDGPPVPGDIIRTKKMSMEGKVERLDKNRDGHNEVFFRIEDGRLMKTPLNNVTVIQKLADEDIVMEVIEDRIDEISTEVLAKYKTAAATDARSADKSGDISRGNKRFSGIVKATKKQFDNDKKKKTEEGSMGGINRSAPAQDVSYEHVLDEVMDLWKAEQLNELSVNKLKAYKDAVTSPEVVKHSPLRKVVKHVQGSHSADQKIRVKTGDHTGEKPSGRGIN